MMESPLTFLRKTVADSESAEAASLATLDGAALLKRINTGQGGIYKGNGNIIDINVIFGDTAPSVVK